MSGEIFSDDLVDVDVDPPRFGDIGDAADGVVGIPFTFAAHHGVALARNQRLFFDSHLLYSRAHGPGDGEFHEQTPVADEPSAKALRRVLRESVLQFVFQPVENLLT